MEASFGDAAWSDGGSDGGLGYAELFGSGVALIAGVEVRTSKALGAVVALWQAGSSLAHSLCRFLKMVIMGSCDC